MKLAASFVALAALVHSAVAQAMMWGMCGGIGWAGPTTCVPGAVCTVLNANFSQCLPVSSTDTTTSTSSTATVGLNTAAKAAGKTYFGSATDNPDPHMDAMEKAGAA